MIINSNKVNLSEEDIENWLWENQPSYITKWLGRQVKLPSGIADLIGIHKDGDIAVIELKNIEIDSAALTQVCRYAKDMENIMDRFCCTHYTEEYMYEHGMLGQTIIQKYVIGKGIPSDKVIFEANALDVNVGFFSVDYSIKLSGVVFTDEKMNEIDQEIIFVANSELMNEFLLTNIVQTASEANVNADNNNGML